MIRYHQADTDSFFSFSAKALNEYLVNLLVERDDLLSKQDEMLEEISELADTLLQK